MDFSKLSQALAPINLGDTALLTVTPLFKLRVVQMANYNQAYNSKLTTFVKANPKHLVARDTIKFFEKWSSNEVDADTVSFMVNVIFAGWELQDDEGNDVPFSTAAATELLTSPFGRTIFGKVANAVQFDTTFTLQWTEDAIKN